MAKQPLGSAGTHVQATLTLNLSTGTHRKVPSHREGKQVRLVEDVEGHLASWNNLRHCTGTATGTWAFSCPSAVFMHQPLLLFSSRKTLEDRQATILGPRGAPGIM